MIFKQIACRQNGTQSLAYVVENFDVSMFGDRGKSITCSACHRVYLENYSVTCRWCNKTHVCLHRCEGSHGRCYYLNRSMWLYRNRCRDNVVCLHPFRLLLNRRRFEALSKKSCAIVLCVICQTDPGMVNFVKRSVAITNGCLLSGTDGYVQITTHDYIASPAWNPQFDLRRLLTIGWFIFVRCSALWWFVMLWFPESRLFY